MNILKSYDFPVASRTDKGIVTESMIKDYFKKHKKDKPISKYANFYFLIYLCKVIDISVRKYNFYLFALRLLNTMLLKSRNHKLMLMFLKNYFLV